MSRQVVTGKVVSASVDWITATATTPAAGKALWDLAVSSLPQRLEESEHPTRWHAHGYDGWKITGLRAASRPDGVLVQFSGRQACNQWQHAVSAADNVTRIDLAVDVEYERPERSCAAKLYRDASHASPRNGRPPVCTLITGSDGGTTCYIGKRASDQLGRCYDKGVEQKSHAAGLRWRWEVEFKSERALHVASELMSKSDDREALIATTLSWFRARGARALPVWSGEAINNWHAVAPVVDKRLQWIARCVRPTVLDLTETLGRQRMLGVLGLPDRSPFPPQSAV